MKKNSQIILIKTPKPFIHLFAFNLSVEVFSLEINFSSKIKTEEMDCNTTE